MAQSQSSLEAKVLQNCMVTLLSSLSPSNFVGDDLFSKGVISFKDLKNIKSKRGEDEQSDALFEILIANIDSASFEVLVTALQKAPRAAQKALATMLLKEKKELERQGLATGDIPSRIGEDTQPHQTIEPSTPTQEEAASTPIRVEDDGELTEGIRFGELSSERKFDDIIKKIQPNFSRDQLVRLCNHLLENVYPHGAHQNIRAEPTDNLTFFREMMDEWSKSDEDATGLKYYKAVHELSSQYANRIMQHVGVIRSPTP